MAEENEVQNEEVVETAVETPKEKSVDEIVAEKVAEELKNIKSNLDKAYERRDEAIKVAEEAKKEIQNKEIENLESQGKVAEALEARMKQYETEMQNLREQNVALSRDTLIREQLSGLEFASAKASGMAAADVKDLVTQKADGSWSGPAGEPISQVIEQYAGHEDNSFLFKAKVSQGSTSVPTGATASADPQAPKSLSDMSVEDAIAAAAAGELGADKRWI